MIDIGWTTGINLHPDRTWVDETGLQLELDAGAERWNGAVDDRDDVQILEQCLLGGHPPRAGLSQGQRSCRRGLLNVSLVVDRRQVRPLRRGLSRQTATRSLGMPTVIGSQPASQSPDS